jgi:UDP-4-amino-4,6-dideoxy-N-acetyl-beta-L-altrosamine transaminase
MDRSQSRQDRPTLTGIDIPYGRQDICDDDVAAVNEVLRSDWLTQGPAVPRFEAAIAGYCSAKHAVAVNSATSALHIACLALGLGPGDRLWTSPNTFVASANCARYCGADVDFVDIDPHTYNISVGALRLKLEKAASVGALPKIVVPVHFAGQSCDMRGIHALSQEFGFRVIEDASHAIGGRYLGQPVGSCRFSDICILSFHPVKIITTAEGGMALTNDSELATRMVRLRSHGITRDPALMECDFDGPWSYQQVDLGFNYRMTDILAALGCSQLTRIDDYVARRREIAARYYTLLADLPLRLPWQSSDAMSAWHLYVVQLGSNLDRRRVFEELRSVGIGVNVHYIPVHTQPYYRRLGFGSGMYPEAESYYSRALSLPMFATLSDTQQDFVLAQLRRGMVA